MQQSLDLIDQLIQMEEEREKIWKALMIKFHKGEQTVGDSAMLTHLRSLKELVLKEFEDYKKLYNGIPPIIKISEERYGDCGPR